MMRACHRCETRLGIVTRVAVNVADLMSYDVLVEEVVLCVWCRNSGSHENAVAMSDRTLPPLPRPKEGW